MAKLRVVGELRQLNQPKPIQVRHQGKDEECRVTAVFKGSAWIAVAEQTDRWKVGPDQWWRETPVERMYFEVILVDHRTLHVFFDQVGKSWYEQRYG